MVARARFVSKGKRPRIALQAGATRLRWARVAWFGGWLGLITCPSAAEPVGGPFAPCRGDCAAAVYWGTYVDDSMTDLVAGPESPFAWSYRDDHLVALAFSREVAQAFRYGTVLAASWYPISWYRDVLAAFRKAVNAGPELPRRIGKLAVQHDIKSAHKRLIAWLVSPQTLLSLSQRVFNSYYDTGSLQIVESRSGFVRMRASGCRGWDVNMWSELAGSSEALLELAGARQAHVRWLTGNRGTAADHEFEAHWKP